MPDISIKALMRLSIPILVAQLAVMALAVIDTVMAGRLSANDLAGVAIGSSVYTSVYIGMMGVVQALTPIAGHHFGAGRWQEVGIDLGQSLWLALAMSAFGLPLLMFNGPWIRAIGAEAAVAEIAQVYLWAAACGLPAALMARAYTSANAALSRPKIAMLINLAALALKLPLNLLFIHGWGPIPALGGAGCGLATALLLWVNAAAHALLWRWDPFYDRFRAAPRDALRPQWQRQKEILRLGLPAGASVLIEVTSFTFITLLVTRLGAITVSAHQIIANLVSVLYMLPLAIGIAVGVLVAQALGAGHPLLARQAARQGFCVALIAALFATACVFVLRVPIANAYSTQEAVVALTLMLIPLAMLFHLFDAVQSVAGFVLRGYKVAWVPLAVHSVSLWGVGLAGGYWLAYHSAFGKQLGGAMAFWVAATAGLTLTAVALAVLTWRTAQRAIKSQSTEAATNELEKH